MTKSSLHTFTIDTPLYPTEIMDMQMQSFVALHPHRGDLEHLPVPKFFTISDDIVYIGSILYAALYQIVDFHRYQHIYVMMFQYTDALPDDLAFDRISPRSQGVKQIFGTTVPYSPPLHAVESPDVLFGDELFASSMTWMSHIYYLQQLEYKPKITPIICRVSTKSNLTIEQYNCQDILDEYYNKNIVGQNACLILTDDARIKIESEDEMYIQFPKQNGHQAMRRGTAYHGLDIVMVDSPEGDQYRVLCAG